MSPDFLVCLSTCPDPSIADAIAATLVEESLAACVTRLPGAVSTYRWDGAIQTGQEVVLLIKTTAGRFEAMKSRLVAIHPYDVPELVALAVADGHLPYLDWVRAGTTPTRGP